MSENSLYLYNTGYLPKNSNKIRLQQRLQPQDISSNCVAPFTKPQVEMFSQRKGDTCGQLSRGNFPTNNFNYKNETTSRPNLYPIKMPGPDYGLKPIPNDSPCLQYLQPI